MQTFYGHILTVMPEGDSQSSMQQFLLDIGFEVSNVVSIAQAAQQFTKTGPDLVITDLDKSEESANHSLTFLSEFTHMYPDVPIITLTVPSQKQVLKSLRLGAWDCIEKPIDDLTQLEQAVCKALERARLVNENKLYRYKLEEMNLALENSLRELKYDQLAGKKVQEQLFPSKDLVIADYHFSHYILPSLYLSGDIVDYFPISDQYIGFYIGDVSGHGASSAFIAIMIKTLFDQMVIGYQQKQTKVILHPKKVFAVANQYLVKAKLGKYITMVYGVLDTYSNKLRYSVAGHYPSPLWVTPTKTHFLSSKSFAIGMVPQAVYEEMSIDFPKDATLAMFSDGLLEVLPGNDLLAKEQLLIDAIPGQVSNTVQPSIPLLAEHFKLEERGKYIDDITMLLISRVYA